MKKLIRRLSSSRHDVPRMRNHDEEKVENGGGHLRPKAKRQVSSPNNVSVINDIPAGLSEKVGVGVDAGAELARRKSEPLPALPPQSSDHLNDTNDSDLGPPLSQVVNDSDAPQPSSTPSIQSSSKRKPVPISSSSLAPPPPPTSPPEGKSLPSPRRSHDLPSLPASPTSPTIPVDEAAIAGGAGLQLDAIRSQPGPDEISISPSQQNAPLSSGGATIDHDAESNFDGRPCTDDEVARIKGGSHFTRKETSLDVTGADHTPDSYDALI